MATSITFWGGVGEIGGNKFLVDADGSRVFLDFGKNFSREKKYFEEPYIRARKEQHLLSLGILPPLKGLYRGEAAAYPLDAILLSHPHTDHYDDLRWVKDAYPVYCGQASQEVILGREFTTRAPAEEYVIAKMTKRDGEEAVTPLKTFIDGKPLQISDHITATPYPVDHSVPGAYAYVLETPGATVAYTGDFRFHGPRRASTARFLTRARSSDIDVLLIEGTHVNESKVESEEEVRAKVAQVASETKQLILVGSAPSDVERLATLLAVAKETGRRLILSTKQAFLVHRLAKAGLLDFDLKDQNILIFQKDKKRPQYYEQLLDEWYPGKLVDAATVNGVQSESILTATLYDMNEMAELKPGVGSLYVLSTSEPYDEEAEISYERLLNWLDYYGLPLYHIHASGHARPHDLKRAVRDIAPKYVFPIHTERPELFGRYLEDSGVKVIAPRRGHAYDLGSLGQSS